MTETVTEWGVRYAHDGSVHVDSHGPSQALARCAVDTYKAITTVPRQDVTLVTRQVTYGAWADTAKGNTMASSPDPAVMLDYAMRALKRLADPDELDNPGDAERSHRDELRARLSYADHAHRAITIGADPNWVADTPVISSAPVKLRHAPHEGDCNETCYGPEAAASTAPEEVTDVSEPDPEQVAEEQDQAAEASQDDEQAEPDMHEANPF